MIVLDTDALIEIMDKRSKKGDKILRTIENANEDIAITSLTLHEILYGIYKYGKNVPRELFQLEAMEYTPKDAILSSKLELEAERKGKKVARIDCMIAAMVINREAKLLTLNKKHFEIFNKLSLLSIK